MHPTPVKPFPTLHLFRPTYAEREFCNVGAEKIVKKITFCYLCTNFYKKNETTNLLPRSV